MAWTRRVAVWAVICGTPLTLAGCGGGSSAPTHSVKTLASIQISPANPSIVAGTSQQFTATGTYSDNSTADLTSAVQWSSSDPGTTIGGGGQASANTVGRPKITATSGTISATTTLIVVVGQSLLAPRFAYATDILESTISIYDVDAATGLLRHAGYAVGEGNPSR